MWWTEIVWWKCQCSDSKGNQLVCSFGVTILVSFVEKGSTTCFSFTKVLSDTFMNPLETSVLAWFVCLHIWFCLPSFPVHCHPLSPSFFFLCFFPYLLLHLFLLVWLSAKGLTGSSFHSNYPRTYGLLSQVPISLPGSDPGASTPLHPLPLLLAGCYVAQTSNERQMYAVVVCPRS